VRYAGPNAHSGKRAASLATASTEKVISYYGVIFNYRALRMFKDCVVRLWRRCSQTQPKGRVTWASYNKLLAAFHSPDRLSSRLGTDDQSASVLPEEPLR